MFKRVLLCYDGSEVGRRALKRGAELAILVGAQVYVLSIIPSGVAGAAVVASAAGFNANISLRTVGNKQSIAMRADSQFRAATISMSR